MSVIILGMICSGFCKLVNPTYHSIVLSAHRHLIRSFKVQELSIVTLKCIFRNIPACLKENILLFIPFLYLELVLTESLVEMSPPKEQHIKFLKSFMTVSNYLAFLSFHKMYNILHCS